MANEYILDITKQRSRRWRLSKLSKVNYDEGFSLLELVVVILIISILSAIALPSFLAQTAKAKQSEAKSTLGNINQAQISYRTQNSSFTASWGLLGLGIPTESSNYSYTITATTDTALGVATPHDTALLGYSSGTVRYQDSTGLTQGQPGLSAIASIICETIATGITTPALPMTNAQATDANSAIACPPETETKI